MSTLRAHSNIDPILINKASEAGVLQELRRYGWEGYQVRKGSRWWEGPCPRCGGTDRFWINEDKNCWGCRGCGKGGDVISLVEHIADLPFAQAVRHLASHITASLPEPKKASTVKPPGQSDADRKRLALRIWESSTSLAGTLGEVYLTKTRHLRFEGVDLDAVLRFKADCVFGSNGEVHPAVIALCRDIVTNEPKAILRRALTPQGQKIGKWQALAATGACAVKLDPDENVTMGLGVAEGIETALAARMKGFIPCWSLIHDAGMAKFPLLAGLESLTLIIDHDPAGRRAAKECGDRWTQANREVREILPPPGWDMADLVAREAVR